MAGSDADYVIVQRSPAEAGVSSGGAETMQERILRVTNDVRDLNSYYDISISPTRTRKLRTYFERELEALAKAPFDHYDEAAKVDYLLLTNWLERRLRDLDLAVVENEKAGVLLSFAPAIVSLCEEQQDMKSLEARRAAQAMRDLEIAVGKVRDGVEDGDLVTEGFVAYRATGTLAALQERLKTWFEFYNGYDPLFTWWVPEPYSKANAAMDGLIASINRKLVGITEGDTDTIIGQPIGRSGLLAEIQAEKIVYTPEQLLEIAESEYKYCESEMRKASRDLGYGDDWRAALESVKNSYLDPGEQPVLIRDLAHEAIDFLGKYDLITVPEIAASTWRMLMMPAEEQKVSPFFLGGSDIQVSYPTNAMAHDDKLMSMRGNNPNFSRSTVFHELIPGHKLQFYSLARHKPHRVGVGDTPFWIEGWAFYWELVLYDNPAWKMTAANRVGMLVWHMHRCARILFSINFHLGNLSPVECVDLLVEKVGWDRANAEGEVRRSLNGDYGPLYQCAYMLGALQFWALRRELVDGGVMGEKAFHDRVLRENMMPLELLRALLKGEELGREFVPRWTFYEGVKASRTSSLR